MNYTKSLKKMDETEVLVCGLGPAGITAAIAAARQGYKVLGIEKCPFAGGNITNASVIGVCGAFDMEKGRSITGGITRELIIATSLLRDPKNNVIQTPLWKIKASEILNYMPVDNIFTDMNNVQFIFDVERFKFVADQMLLKNGVSILYHTTICDVITKNDHIEEIILANKDGLSYVRPKIVIDCTGDGDVAAWSGAPFKIENKIQTGTTMFSVGGIRYDNFQEFTDKLVNTVEQAHERGEIGLYCGPDRGVVWPGVINFNMTRLPFNQTIASELSAAEIRGRQDIDLFMKVFKKYLPEYFGAAYLISTGPYVGARESRRIEGVYKLTLDDVIAGRNFEDTIALGGHFVDFHDSAVSGFKSGEIKLRMLKPYAIPYRTLVPKVIDNLLVAGRCHSVIQSVAASSRVAATAMLMGEAAGAGAAIALKDECVPAEINTGKLVKILLKNGAVLE